MPRALQGLGDDWESTPWVHPSNAKAKQYSRHHQHADGRAQLCGKPRNKLRAERESFHAMGEGMVLYFVFIKVRCRSRSHMFLQRPFRIVVRGESSPLYAPGMFVCARFSEPCLHVHCAFHSL